MRAASGTAAGASIPAAVSLLAQGVSTAMLHASLSQISIPVLALALAAGAVVGPRGEMKMTILGPVRKATQIEISLTDARAMGLNPPVRESGDIAASAPCTLVGPSGKVELKEGVIAAKRHIHMHPDDAARFGVQDKQVVGVRINTDGRSLVFDDTVVRVNPTYALAMHIDTDESNAAAAAGEVYGELVK